MIFIKKIIFFLVRIELGSLNTKNLKYTQHFSFNYISTLPNLYKIPVIIFLIMINLFPILFYGKLFYNLDSKDAMKYLNFLLSYFPLFPIFKKFYRTIFLLANYS